MQTKDRLQIILITYNRDKYLKETFEQLYAETSPIKDFDILVLDNNSTDKTAEYVNDLKKTHPNLRYQKNRYNLGLSGNIAKAIEIAEKDYVWIIADDDLYDFSNWAEVEKAINNDEKAICISRYVDEKNIDSCVATQLLQMVFLPATIFKTSIFSDTVIRNVYDNIFTVMPHVCPLINLINNGEVFYVTKKSIVENGMENETKDCCYLRGSKNDDLYERTRSMSWMVGYANILSNLKDKKIARKSFNIAAQYIHNGWANFYHYTVCSYLHPDRLMHFVDLYMAGDKKMKCKLLKNYFLPDLKIIIKKPRIFLNKFGLFIKEE